MWLRVTRIQSSYCHFCSYHCPSGKPLLIDSLQTANEKKRQTEWLSKHFKRWRTGTQKFEFTYHPWEIFVVCRAMRFYRKYRLCWMISNRESFFMSSFSNISPQCSLIFSAEKWLHMPHQTHPKWKASLKFESIWKYIWVTSRRVRICRIHELKKIQTFLSYLNVCSLLFYCSLF